MQREEDQELTWNDVFTSPSLKYQFSCWFASGNGLMMYHAWKLLLEIRPNFFKQKFSATFFNVVSFGGKLAS